MSKINYYQNKSHTWVEIDRKAIAKNFALFRRIVGKKVQIMAVVKSNAYGHGMVPFACEAIKGGANWLAVDDIEEALLLRKEGIKIPILVFGFTPKEYFRDAVKNNISLTVSNFGMLEDLSKVKGLRVHIKVDTGLGRQGFLLRDSYELLKKIENIKNINIEGLYTHLAATETLRHGSHTKKQLDEYALWQALFDEYSPICHVASSAGAMLGREFHYDMVRVGISSYGLWASPEIQKKLANKLPLHPVLSWKSVVSEVKDVPKGSPIGYDLTEKTKRDSSVAVVPVGYWHGYPRSLSSRGIVMIRGKKCKVIGRISMDMFVVDVTSVRGLKRGDEVEIIGKNITADEVAHLAGTINYEIITRINPLIYHFYR